MIACPFRMFRMIEPANNLALAYLTWEKNIQSLLIISAMLLFNSTYSLCWSRLVKGDDNNNRSNPGVAIVVHLVQRLSLSASYKDCLAGKMDRIWRRSKNLAIMCLLVRAVSSFLPLNACDTLFRTPHDKITPRAKLNKYNLALFTSHCPHCYRLSHYRCPSIEPSAHFLFIALSKMKCGPLHWQHIFLLFFSVLRLPNNNNCCTCNCRSLSYRLVILIVIYLSTKFLGVYSTGCLALPLPESL